MNTNNYRPWPDAYLLSTNLLCINSCKDCLFSYTMANATYTTFTYIILLHCLFTLSTNLFLAQWKRQSHKHLCNMFHQNINSNKIFYLWLYDENSVSQLILMVKLCKWYSIFEFKYSRFLNPWNAHIFWLSIPLDVWKTYINRYTLISIGTPLIDILP